MVSVIIATHESERALVRTLAALVAGAAAGAVREVIVSDAKSSDATLDVADLAGCRIVVSEATLGARLRAAASLARAPWLMFLKPGMVLDATWIDETGRFIAEDDGRDQTRSRAAVFRRAPPPSARQPAVIEAFSLLGAALGCRPRPEQGLLIARQLYDLLGGHRDSTADPERDLIRRVGR